MKPYRALTQGSEAPVRSTFGLASQPLSRQDVASWKVVSLLLLWSFAVTACAKAIEEQPEIDSDPSNIGNEERSSEDTIIHCGLIVHPLTSKLADFALYVTAGYLRPGKPKQLAVLFAMWEDGTVRWLPEFDPNEEPAEYFEAVLSTEKREALLGILRRGFETLPLPQETAASGEMHVRRACLIVLLEGQGIALSRRFTSAGDDNPYSTASLDASSEYREWWEFAAEAFREVTAGIDGRGITWTPAKALVSRSVKRL